MSHNAKLMKIYQDTFKFKFANINGMLAIEWEVKYKANIFQDKTVKSFG